MTSKLFLDNREPRTLIDMLSDIGEVTTLTTGDYLGITDSLTWAIERKAIGDLLSSLTDGRLYEQLKRLIDSVDVPILLLENIYSSTHNGYIRLPSKELGFRYESVENLLLDAQMRGIILARTPSLEASAKLIRGYNHYFSKEGHRFEVKKQRLFSYSAKVTPQLQLVCALPGVNWQLGHRLLDLFGSPLAVFVADEKILQAVDGIGKKKARVIRATLREGVDAPPPPHDLPHKAPGKDFSPLSGKGGLPIPGGHTGNSSGGLPGA